MEFYNCIVLSNKLNISYMKLYCKRMFLLQILINRQRHFLVILLALSLLVFKAIPPAFSEESPLPLPLTEVKLQLHWKHQFEFSGFYAAIEKGYFREYGIKLSFNTYKNNDNYIQNVLSEGIEFGLAGPGIIQDYHNNIDVKLLANYYKRSPLILITQPEISSIKQLVNKTIHGKSELLYSGGIREMLNLYNIDPLSISTTLNGSSIELFKNKKISGILAFSTNEPFQLAQQNIAFKVHTPNEFGLFTQDLNLFTSGGFAKNNPELVKNFINAVNKGWAYAIKHPDEIIQLIKSKYDEQNKSIAALQYEARESIKLMSSDIYPIGSIQKNQIISISESMLANKTINKIRNIDKLLFESNVERNTDKELLALLTKEELEYLKAHPIITAQSDTDNPPFNYPVADKPSGYSIDLITKIAEMLNIKVEFIENKTWSEYVTMFKQKKLEILLNIINTQQRQKFANFTSDFAEIPTFAVIRNNKNIDIANQINIVGMRIALIDGYAINDSIKNALPNSTFILVKNVSEALKSLTTLQADIYFEVASVINYHIKNKFIPNLQLIPVADDIKLINQNLSFATHKDNETLRNILQKAMNAIPAIEQIRLKEKWFVQNEIENDSKLTLTKEEEDYIAKNSPFTFCRQNITGYDGRDVKVFDFITRDIGIKVELSELMSWNVALNALKDNKCDILTTATATVERRKVYNFTPAYTRIKEAIATKKNKEMISDLSDHLIEKFVIVKGHALIKSLKKEYPTIKLVEVKTSVDAVTLLKSNKVFGYIDAEWSLKSLLNEDKGNNLKINGQLRDKFDDLQSIATRKEDVLLNSILSKAVSSSDKLEITKVMTDAYQLQVNKVIEFTDEEKNLLDTRNIYWCYTDVTDLETWDQLMPIITKKTKIKLFKSKKMSWSNALKGLVMGNCDILPEVTETPERKKTMIFSPPIHQEERIITTLRHQPYISNIEDHFDKVFAIHRGDILAEQLRAEYPRLKIKLTDYQLEGLQWVQNQQVFAYIGSIADTGNTLNKYAMENLKIAGTLPDRFNDSWAFATRKDDVVLHSIFNKLLKTTDKKKLREVISGQYLVNYENFDYKLFWQFLIIALVILSAVIFWNRRLAKLNIQLEKAKTATEEAHKTIIIQEKMSSLGTLTAGVAHEINNPVNFTYAAVYMMKEEITQIKAFLKELAGGDKADEKVLQSFEDKFAKLIDLTHTATEGSNRIKTIVQDLRLFSRLDDEEQEKITLAAIIRSTTHLVKTQFNDIDIELDVVSDPLIKAFPAKLSQVFMNIIVNASQAIETRKRADNQLIGKINISLFEKNNYVYIEFSDNGCGMDEETLKKVFDPFFTTKDVGSGTGLGMAISFGIIEEHGGLIEINSKVNEGSSLTIKLPIKWE